MIKNLIIWLLSVILAFFAGVTLTIGIFIEVAKENDKKIKYRPYRNWKRWRRCSDEEEEETE